MAKSAKTTKQTGKPKTRPQPAAANGTPERIIEDRIRERAYQLFLERGGLPGDPLADWLRAEREVTVAA